MNRRELLKGFGASLLAGGPILAATSLKRPDPPQTAPEPRSATTGREKAPERSDMERLLDAIMWVESKGDAYALGDRDNLWNARAIGAYQIWKICVDDVNRIVAMHHVVSPKQKFTYDDRFNPVLSRSMCRIYITHYGSSGGPVKMARCWNGGPRGHLKPATLHYWFKVNAAMREAEAWDSISQIIDRRL